MNYHRIDMEDIALGDMERMASAVRMRHNAASLSRG